METNVWSIGTPEQLLKLRDEPEGRFCLSGDIDLAGAFWKPADFNGILDGCGHTIRNVRIVEADEKGYQGFFGQLGENARVTDLKLLGLQITGDPAASHIGTLVGMNLGTVEHCTVGADAPWVQTRSGKRRRITGQCDDSWIRDRRTKGVQIGAIAGGNRGTICSVRAYAMLHTAMQSLCPDNTGTLQGLWRDCTNRSELLGAEAQLMRQRIVRHMADMGSFRWIPTKDMHFTSAYSTGTPVTYAKDVVHYGLPYTQKFGSLERAQSCLEPGDFVQSWLPEYSDRADTDPDTPYSGWDVYLGTDCSGAVYWAWCRCCTDVAFEYTAQMVPTPENQETYQILPVGDYTAHTNMTQEVIAANGPEKIMECYAQLHMGDAIVARNPVHGHTRLVMRDPMVIRDEAGHIDMDASYIPTHEQGVGKGSCGWESTWQLSCRYPFRELVVEYLPVTNPDLRRGKPAPVALTLREITGPFSGSISSNYRIISTTVELEHLQTHQRFSSTLYPTVVRKHIDPPQSNDNLARSTVKTVALSRHLTDLPSLPAGEYHFRVSVRLSNGGEYMVHGGQHII